MSRIEWDHRELCADGACIGVIGDDGLCKVCGRAAPNWGEERMRGLLTEEDAGAEAADEELGDEEPDDAEGADEYDDGDEDEDEGDDADEDEDGDEAGEDDARGARAAAGARGGDEDWDRRELCPDGACVGVIGADGACTVCGRKPA